MEYSNFKKEALRTETFVPICNQCIKTLEAPTRKLRDIDSATCGVVDCKNKAQLELNLD